MHLNKSMTRFLTNILVIFSLLFMLSPNILNAAWGLNMTQGVTPISQDVYNMHMTSLYVVTVIGILVFGVMFWSIFHHRKSKGVKPAKFSHSTTVEVIWTLIPFAIIVALAIPATKLLARMDDTSKSEITINWREFSCTLSCSNSAPTVRKPRSGWPGTRSGLKRGSTTGCSCSPGL